MSSTFLVLLLIGSERQKLEERMLRQEKKARWDYPPSFKVIS
jgi:hypothetical protein